MNKIIVKKFPLELFAFNGFYSYNDFVLIVGIDNKGVIRTDYFFK